MDETNPAPSPDVAAAVAESNQATSTSLSTAVTADSPQEAPDAASVGAPVVPAPDPVTPLAPGAEQATPNMAAEAPGAFPAALLARLHADLEALEQKIELGIHVFAHEVAAIREQVSKLI